MCASDAEPPDPLIVSMPGTLRYPYMQQVLAHPKWVGTVFVPNDAAWLKPAEGGVVMPEGKTVPQVRVVFLSSAKCADVLLGCSTVRMSIQPLYFLWAGSVVATARCVPFALSIVITLPACPQRT